MLFPWYSRHKRWFTIASWPSFCAGSNIRKQELPPSLQTWELIRTYFPFPQPEEKMTRKKGRHLVSAPRKMCSLHKPWWTEPLAGCNSLKIPTHLGTDTIAVKCRRIFTITVKWSQSAPICLAGSVLHDGRCSSRIAREHLPWPSHYIRNQKYLW